MYEKTMWVQTLWNPIKEINKSPMESKEEGIRVAAYCRISSNHNNFASLENQVNYYTNLIKNKPNWKFVGIYFDDGISAATSEHRPGFRRMLRHCEEGRIDLILTKSISRFSRNSKILLDVVNRLKEKKIAIFFEKENIDTALNYNQFVLSIYAAVEQDEIETMSQLARLGHERKFIKGIPAFSNLYGYDIEKREGNVTVKINEEEARVVRWIFNEFLEGKTYADINRELVKRDVKTKTGNTNWSSAYVRKLLMNIAYTGNKIARKQTKDLLTGKIKTTTHQRDKYYINNSHPAIISDEIYALAQRRSQEVGYKNKTPHASSCPRPFSKRIICGRCGKIFRAQYTSSWGCGNSLPSVGLCISKKLKDKNLIQMSIKALKERFDFQSQGTLKELLKILEKINRNDHFEFHRLKHFTEIELIKITILEEDPEFQEKLKEAQEAYKTFEKKVSQIEDDRIYRDKAISWLDEIYSLEEFQEKATVEVIRAWVKSIVVYSESAFIVHWIDEVDTVIGEDIIKEMIEENRKREERVQQKLSFPEDDMPVLEESQGHLYSGPYLDEEVDVVIAAKTNLQDTTSAIISNGKPNKRKSYTKLDYEVIKIEPGSNFDTLTNIKKNLVTTRAMDILNENQKKLRVASYCRTSTLFGQQQVSLQSQIAYYTYLILKNPKWTYAGIFSDPGVSGSSLEGRDGFMRMIEEAKAGKIDLIITKSISRFSRNVLDVLEVLKELKELNVHCYFEKENIHTADDKASLLITLMSSIAQNEIISLSSNITWGIKRLAQRGIIHRTTDIYGYTIDQDRNWEVVSQEAEVVLWIAKGFLEGKGFPDIIKGLHDKGIKSPKGNDYWSENTIREILKSEKYKGDYLFQKHYTPEVIGAKPRVNKGEVEQYYIEKHHPAIIDENTWQLMQEEFQRRSRGEVKDVKPLRTAGRESFYQKFTCKECDGVISRYRSGVRDSKEGSMWRCYNSYGNMNIACSSPVSIREEYIEYHFMKTLGEIYEKTAFRRLVQKEIEKLTLTEAELLQEKEIKEKMESLNQELYEAVDDEMTKGGYDTKRIDFLTGEIIKLQNELKAFTDRVEKIEFFKGQLKELVKVCKEVRKINFRDFHHMDVRIKPGESLYNTTKNAKDSTYIKEGYFSQFRGDVFEKYVLSGAIGYDGSITYTFLFGIDYGVKITYGEYLETFEETKKEINLEELVNSKEGKVLKEFCTEARTPKEMRELLNISSKVSFDKRILKPLVQAGKLKLIRGSRSNDWRYYWEEEKSNGLLALG